MVSSDLCEMELQLLYYLTVFIINLMAIIANFSSLFI